VSREDESVQVDSYLDALLAARERDRPPTVDVAADLRSAAGSVQRALPRFHPSFAFEERLAGQLRALAGTEPAGTVIAFPARAVPPVAGPERRARGVILGGAIASGVSIAGVSLAAGAALLARRRAKPSVTVL
jgi:hypothetical protein